MSNKLIKQLIYLSFSLILLGSCKKNFLDITPKGVQLVKTVNDYDNLLNISSISMTASTAEVMGDEVVAADPGMATWANSIGFPNLRSGFKWAEDVYLPDQDASEMEVFMGNLYTYNKVINEVMDAALSEDDKKDPSEIKAEALANRAWCYMWLINYYGKPYKAATAATDPGVPIIKSADVTQTKFVRSSVQAVYDFILSDLKTAIPNLSKNITDKYRMSRPAAEAILGKTYWFMGKYDSALLAFNASFEDIQSQPANALPTGLYDLKDEMTPTGVYAYDAATTPLFYITGPANDNINKEILFSRSYTWTAVILPYVLLEADKINIFPPSDQRRKFFSSISFGGSPATVDNFGDFRRLGPYNLNIGMNIPDMYLMQAECMARTKDLSGAATTLENFRKYRMSEADAAVPKGLSEKQLVELILKERLREYACQGYRWFDMRRMSVDPFMSGAYQTFTHVYHGAAGDESYTFQDPNRFTLRFPQKVIDQNNGMENNP